MSLFTIFNVAGSAVSAQSQRLNVIAELLAFFVHAVDRLVSERGFEEAKRRELITALAKSLAKTMHDNRVDFEGEGNHREVFVNLLNERMSEYAGFNYIDGEPGFQLRRRVGEHVQAMMGEKNNKWVPDQVIEIEIPEAMKVLKKAARNLV